MYIYEVLEVIKWGTRMCMTVKDENDKVHIQTFRNKIYFFLFSYLLTCRPTLIFIMNLLFSNL